MQKRKRNVIYSTDWQDGKPPKAPKREVASLPPEKQMAHLHREKKGRGGKWVVVVKGLQLNTADTKALAKHLRKTCGSGGTIKDGNIEIQGDHRDKVAAALQKLGYKTKNVGG